MANEISLTSGFTLSKSGLVVSSPAATTKLDFAGEFRHSTTQNVGTTYEALDVGELTSVEYGQFTNLDATNYVEIGREVAAAFYGVIKILPGKTSPLIPLATAALFARANTGAVRLDFTLLGND